MKKTMYLLFSGLATFLLVNCGGIAVVDPPQDDDAVQPIPQCDPDATCAFFGELLDPEPAPDAVVVAAAQAICPDTLAGEAYYGMFDCMCNPQRLCGAICAGSDFCNGMYPKPTSWHMPTDECLSCVDEEGGSGCQAEIDRCGLH